MEATRRKILIGAALGLGRDRLVLLGTKGGPRVAGYAPDSVALTGAEKGAPK